MMLLIDAFICVRVYKLDSGSCPSTACNMCAAAHFLFKFAGVAASLKHNSSQREPSGPAADW